MSTILAFINSLPGAVGQGLAWGIMAIGVYITYRILDIADLTVDGSLATGGAVCAIAITGTTHKSIKTMFLKIFIKIYLILNFLSL